MTCRRIKKKERRKDRNARKKDCQKLDQRKCLAIFICIFHFTRIQPGRVAPIFIDIVRLWL